MSALRPWVVRFRLPVETASAKVVIGFVVVLPATTKAHAKRLALQAWPEASKVQVEEGCE